MARKSIRKATAAIMAAVMTCAMVPQVSWAKDDAVATTTDATSAADETGYVTMKLTGLGDVDPTGQIYSIYSSICLNEEYKVGEFTISYDGKSYIEVYGDDNEEINVTYGAAELESVENPEIKYVELPVGTYYLERTDAAATATSDDDTNGISYAASMQAFNITAEHGTKETALVVSVDAGTCENDTGSVSLMAENESATLFGSSTIHLYYQHSTTVGSTTGGLFWVTGGIVAYCSDHYKSTPAEGDYSYSAFEAPYSSVASYGGSGANMRKVIAYGIETYGTSYSSISNANRLRMSIALYNAKYGATHSVGTAINEAAYAMFSSDPITIDDATFTFSDGSTALDVTVDATKTITTQSGTEVSVKYSSAIQLKGSKSNKVTVTIPTGTYVKWNGTWYEPGTTFTCTGISKLYVALVATAQKSHTIKLEGSTGYDVYEMVVGTNYQTIYWGTSGSSSATLTVTPGEDDEEEEDPETPKYLYVHKVSSNDDVSTDTEHYNMAGIGYRVYSDKNCTTVATSVDYSRTISGSSISIANSSYFFLSWNGKPYMDKYGYNVIFVSKAAYNDFKEKEGYTPYEYRIGYMAGTYYVKERDTTLSVRTSASDSSPRYWYDNSDGDFADEIAAHADADVEDVSGYAYSSTVYTATVPASVGLKLEVEDNPEHPGSAQLIKTIEGEESDKSEGLTFYLYKMNSSSDTKIVSSKKIATFKSEGGSSFSITIDDDTLGMTVSGNVLKNMPYGRYAFVEDASIAKSLGFTPASNVFFTLSVTNKSQKITMDNEYTDSGSVRVTKYLDGALSTETDGLTFYLYKMSSSTSTDISSAEKIATYESVTDGGANNSFKITIDTTNSSYNVEANGNYVDYLPEGRYAVVEDATIAASLGFDVADTQYFTLAKGEKKEITMDDTRTSIKLQKSYDDSTIGALSNYSLAGATFEMYLVSSRGSQTATSANYIGTFTTDASGVGYVTDVGDSYVKGDASGGKYYSIRGIPSGKYVYVKETSASSGCGLADDQWIYVDNGDHIANVVKVVEPVETDMVTLDISKKDSQTYTTSAAGAASLKGAQFTMSYYDVDVSSVTTYEQLVASGASPTRTWVYETDEQGYIDPTDEEYLVGGDEFYTDSDGNVVMPLGVVIIEETLAPEGYTNSAVFRDGTGTISSNEDGVVFILLKGDTNTKLSATYSCTDVVMRADLKLTKLDASTGETMAGVVFKLSSKTTGESHILVTDENGIIDTSAIAHSTETNANDDEECEEYSVCGIWFYGNEEQTGAIDDALGALPYDVYILEEIDTDANDGYILCEPIEIDLTDDSIYDENGYILYEAFDVTNVPVPSISTTAYGKATETSVIPVDESAVICDKVSYSYLTAGETYTVKGILVDAATGEFVKNEDGNYVTGYTTFVVDEEYESYKEEKNGYIFVEFTLDTTLLAGQTFVVYEYLFAGDDAEPLEVVDGAVDETNVYKTNTGVVIKHDDIEDVDQTVYVPSIGTTLTNKNDGAHTVEESEHIVLIDTVAYENLVAGVEYTMTGVLMDKATGDEFLDATGATVMAVTTFTPTNADGYVEMVFEFNGKDMDDKSVVAYETMAYNDVAIVSHTDITDLGQTVTLYKVEEPTTETTTEVTTETTTEISGVMGATLEVTTESTTEEATEEAATKETKKAVKTGDVSPLAFAVVIFLLALVSMASIAYIKIKEEE